MGWTGPARLRRPSALAGASTRLWRGLSLHPEALRRFAQAWALIDAATKQLTTLPFYNSFFQTATPPAIELAELLAEVTPPQFNLRNELMVARHVHATALARLLQPSSAAIRDSEPAAMTR